MLTTNYCVTQSCLVTSSKQRAKVVRVHFYLRRFVFQQDRPRQTFDVWQGRTFDGAIKCFSTRFNRQQIRCVCFSLPTLLKALLKAANKRAREWLNWYLSSHICTSPTRNALHNNHLNHSSKEQIRTRRDSRLRWALNKTTKTHHCLLLETPKLLSPVS